jgi:Amt family ammonium transporter
VPFENDFIGGFDAAFLDGIGIGGDDGGLNLAIIAYLGMFACITPALISGAVAGRMKFTAWRSSCPCGSARVRPGVQVGVRRVPRQRGSLDFAGGTAIHVNAGIAALAAVLVLGKRKGWPREGHPPHSMPLVMIGTGILWFGWFGFNAGSALAANGQAAQAFMNTFLAAAAAGLAWHSSRSSATATSPTSAQRPASSRARRDHARCRVRLGHVADLHRPRRRWVCSYAVRLKFRAKYDDALDVVGVHFVGRTRRLARDRLLRRSRSSSKVRSTRGLFYGG